MLFNQVIGQSSVKESLRKMVDTNRIPHALLFLGPCGSGKLALALAFAQYLLCESKADGAVCGKCPHCIKAGKLVHPDVHFSFPTVGTNVKSDDFLKEWRKALEENPYMDINQWMQQIGAENKQANINKEECLNIIRKLSLKTFESNHKVMIIWLPEFLGKEGNRLLKIIEEPPENTNFILVAENVDLILNTILSRCQIVKINQLLDEEVVEGLKRKKDVSDEKAHSVAHLVDGDLNEAMKMLEQEENDHANLFLDWMRKSYIGNGVDMMKWVEQFAGLGRENQKQFMRYALHFMREYTRMKMAGRGQVRLQNKELETAKKLTKVIEFEQIEKIVQLFSDCSYYIERNANPKVLFLDTSIELNHILKKKVRVHQSDRFAERSLTV